METAANSSNAAVVKTLSLMKGKEHFCFRYEVGQESRVLDALIEMVNRRELSFDWFDAANGSVRERVLNYASGRNDPKGPLGPKEYFVSMDRYCGFVYHELLVDLLRAPRVKRP